MLCMPYDRLRGRDGRASFTLVELVVVVAIGSVFISLGLAAVQRVRAAAQRTGCVTNLREIGLALVQYHEIYQSLPPGVVHPAFPPPLPQLYGPNRDPYPLLNWHGRLLPFIEQNPLWWLTEQAFRIDWYYQQDPPHVGLTTPMPLYVCPTDGFRMWRLPGGEPSPASTSYLGVSGTNDYRHDGLLFLDSHIHLADISDGTSNTLMVGERPPSLEHFYGRWYGSWGPWGMANAYLGVAETDVHEDYFGCPPGPYYYRSDSVNNPCSIFHFWSQHPGGANFLFADGSVRFIGYDAASVMPALATRAGGEAVSPP